MAIEADSTTTRRDQLALRLAAIRARIEELQEGSISSRGNKTTNEQRAAALRQVATSLAAVEQAVAACVSALRRAADAHDRTAELYEQAAAAGGHDVDWRSEKAASHRAAATADRQRADQIDSVPPEAEAHDGSLHALSQSPARACPPR